jgi:CRP/FNR family cyclic AMP-dependent transcriptional regulator
MKKIVSTETFSDGQVIIKQGSFGEGTYVILSGKVAINVKDNGVNINVAFLQKGDLLGYMSFIDRQPRSASAMAVGEVQVGLFDKDYLDTEVNKTSEDFQIILKAMSERLRDTTTQLVNISVKYFKLTGSLE